MIHIVLTLIYYIDIKYTTDSHSNKQKLKIMALADYNLKWLMNPPEARASLYEVRGSVPCLFSGGPMSHHHLLIALIILCLSCNGVHA